MTTFFSEAGISSTAPLPDELSCTPLYISIVISYRARDLFKISTINILTEQIGVSFQVFKQSNNRRSNNTGALTISFYCVIIITGH